MKILLMLVTLVISTLTNNLYACPAIESIRTESDLTCSAKVMKLFYINGVATSYNVANQTLNAIENFSLDSRLNMVDGNASVEFKLGHNQTYKKSPDDPFYLYIVDFLEAGAMIIADRFDLSLNDSWGVIYGLFKGISKAALIRLHPVLGLITDPAEYLHPNQSKAEFDLAISEQVNTDVTNVFNQVKTALNGKEKVILLTHSQGGLFANAVWDRIFQDNTLTENAYKWMATLQIATPASEVKGFKKDHLTNDDDSILLLRFLPGIPSPLEGNTVGASALRAQCNITSDDYDFAEHDIFWTYLNSIYNNFYRNQIANKLISLAEELESSCEVGPDHVVPVIKVTSKNPSDPYHKEYIFDGSGSYNNVERLQWNIFYQKNGLYEFVETIHQPASAGTFPPFDYTFDKAGNWGVELIAWPLPGQDGGAWYVNQNVNIARQSIPPVARIAWVNGPVPTLTNFTFTSESYDPDGYINQLKWGIYSPNFDFEQQGIGEEFTVNLPRAGFYIINLEATNDLALKHSYSFGFSTSDRAPTISAYRVEGCGDNYQTLYFTVQDEDSVGGSADVYARQSNGELYFWGSLNYVVGSEAAASVRTPQATEFVIRSSKVGGGYYENSFSVAGCQ